MKTGLYPASGICETSARIATGPYNTEPFGSFLVEFLLNRDFSMKITLLVISSVLLLLAGSASPAMAEESSLKNLLSFDNDKEQHNASHFVQPVNRAKNSSPSIWTKIGHDMKRLNNGTKRFFSNTANALCWKKKTSPPPASRTSNSFGRASSKPKENTSWFKPFWTREEPSLPESTRDFVGMERPRM